MLSTGSRLGPLALDISGAVRACARYGVLHFEQKCLRTNMEFVRDDRRELDTHALNRPVRNGIGVGSCSSAACRTEGLLPGKRRCRFMADHRPVPGPWKAEPGLLKRSDVAGGRFERPSRILRSPRQTPVRYTEMAPDL